MSTQVYYNFPEIELPVQGLDPPSAKEIQLSIPGLPSTNIMLHDKNYIAYSVFIASSTGNSEKPMYLIVKCYSDVNDTTSNIVYLAIPLKIDPQNKKPSDVDNIINSTKDTASVKLSLNNYISTGDNCIVPPTTSFPLTIILGADSEIPIMPQTNNTKFYNLGQISKLETIEKYDVSSQKNATMKQQDLDWIMSCELLTEDGPVKSEQIDPGATATTISLFLMAILIAGTVNVIGPIIYTGFGMYDLAQKLKGNHNSINFFWGVTLFLIAFMCIGQGSHDKLFYFIAIGLGLSYFAGTSGVLKLNKPGIANLDGNWFDNTEEPLQIYREIFSSSCYYPIMGLIAKILIFVFLVSSFMTACGAIWAGSSAGFMFSMVMYLAFALLQLLSIKYLNK
jgi:hypothetical protein